MAARVAALFVDLDGDRPVPSVERALNGPGSPGDASWRRRVKVVAGGQGPGQRDREALDRDRARMPLPGPRRIAVLGCTSGAGQSVIALMTGHTLAAAPGGSGRRARPQSRRHLARRPHRAGHVGDRSARRPGARTRRLVAAQARDQARPRSGPRPRRRGPGRRHRRRPAAAPARPGGLPAAGRLAGRAVPADHDRSGAVRAHPGAARWPTSWCWSPRPARRRPARWPTPSSG